MRSMAEPSRVQSVRQTTCSWTGSRSGTQTKRNTRSLRDYERRRTSITRNRSSGFRATVGVNVIANNVVQRTFEHEAGACAILDPCGSDRFWTFDEVIPVGVMNRADRLEIYHVQR
jgi:hypothetical protein